LNLYIQKESERSGVTIMGEVDMSNADVLGDYLTQEIKAEKCDLFLDLSALTFIDSSGLAVLLNARRLLQASGRSLILGSPSPAVARVLQVTGLDQLFETDIAYANSAVRQSA